MNQIYLIQSLEDSYYKIGVSKHPQKRLKENQTGNSSELKLIETFESDLAFQIEGILHRRYSHLKKEGEWYNLDLKHQQSFLKECKEIEDNLKTLNKVNDFFI